VISEPRQLGARPDLKKPTALRGAVGVWDCESSDRIKGCDGTCIHVVALPRRSRQLEHNQSRSLLIFPAKKFSRLAILLRTFLARDAVTRPGQGLEALRADFLFADHALTEGTVSDARQGRVYTAQQTAGMRGLLKQKFLVERTVGTVAFVGTVGVLHGPTLFLGLGNALQEFLASLQQLFLEALDPFLFHSDYPPIRGRFRTLFMVPEPG